MSFLVVEQDEHLRSGVKELLRLVWPQAKVVTAHSGEQALELVNTQSLKIVLLANNLNDMSALAILNQLAIHPQNKHAPIVGLTTYAPDHDEETAEIWQRATACLEKPYTVEQLVEKVKYSLTATLLPLFLL